MAEVKSPHPAPVAREGRWVAHKLELRRRRIEDSAFALEIGAHRARLALMLRVFGDDARDVPIRDVASSRDGRVPDRHQDFFHARTELRLEPLAQRRQAEQWGERTD